MRTFMLLLAWLLLPALALMGIVLSASLRRYGDALAVTARAQAAGIAVASLALVLYVASEDDYRDNGTSRWDAYGAQEITVVGVALGLTAALILGAASLLRRRDLAVGGFLVSSAAAVVVFVAIFANSLN